MTLSEQSDIGSLRLEAEREMTLRLAALELERADLLELRRGMESHQFPGLYWCVVCGNGLVNPAEGFDTCVGCCS